MKGRDPLGIVKKLNDVRESHKVKTIDRDQFDTWLQHPVTKRLFEECACELHESALSGQFVSPDKVESVEMIINWMPSELREDS